MRWRLNASVRRSVADMLHAVAPSACIILSALRFFREALRGATAKTPKQGTLKQKPSTRCLSPARIMLHHALRAYARHLFCAQGAGTLEQRNDAARAVAVCCCAADVRDAMLDAAAVPAFEGALVWGAQHGDMVVVLRLLAAGVSARAGQSESLRVAAQLGQFLWSRASMVLNDMHEACQHINPTKKRWFACNESHNMSPV